ncbi:SMODS domain-containing nucleotidyltransferase [Streptomyces sp. DT195]|uniref:SMODS domain-containing nucleotidyltransferase n=1 Tax=Streptomyces sp. DT195 TaxID=3393419 RepID=UPI003CEE60E8
MKLIGYFNVLLKDTINLNQTRLNQLDDHVEAIMSYLKSDAVLGPLIQGMDKQGSWAHRTIIKPVAGKNDEFDADFLLTLEVIDEWEDSPEEYLNLLFDALKRSSIYKPKVIKKNRCVRINYANDCHVDIVPHLVLDDGREVIVNSEEAIFEETNPKGYTDWMKERDRLAQGNLRKVIRLLKYLRDSKDTFSVPSVILTALLGEHVQIYDAKNRYRDVPTTLVNLVEDLSAWLDLNPIMPSLSDPSCPQTTFNHRWDQDKYTNFATCMRSFTKRMRDAYDEEDKETSVRLWQDLFGDGFKAPATTASVVKSQSPGTAAPAERAPREVFVEELGSPFAGGRWARIEATVPNGIGRGSVDLRRVGFVPRGRDIHFSVRTDTPTPYEVWWKVRNSGEDAVRASGLRGEIQKSRGSNIRESTLYRGRHFVEVWIVKDGRIVASDHQDVVIT